MNTFQIFGIGLAAVFVLLVLAAAWRRKIGRPAAVFWLALWASAGLAIAWPELTVMVARALGIARGADLIFYCAILAGFVAVFTFHVRLRRLEENITRLVRHVALSEVRDDDRDTP